VRLVIRLARAQFQQPGLGFVQVLVDLEADVKLLGNDLVGPARSLVAVDPLQTDEKSVLTVDAREVRVRLRVLFKTGGLLTERRQRSLTASVVQMPGPAAGADRAAPPTGLAAWLRPMSEA
jgi:hypothetical protein